MLLIVLSNVDTVCYIHICTICMGRSKGRVGYKSDVSLKRGYKYFVPWKMMPLFSIVTAKTLLIVGLKLLIILSL